MTTQTEKMPADNERFGATAAGRADLKGSAGMPPLRQAAIPLAAMQRKASSREHHLEEKVQPDNLVEKIIVPKKCVSLRKFEES